MGAQPRGGQARPAEDGPGLARGRCQSPACVCLERILSGVPIMTTVDYEFCVSCGEVVKRVTRQAPGIFQRMTSHANPVADEKSRCEYDSGPYLGGRARAYPGDTI